MPFKNVTATTKDGTIYKWVDDKWDKEIVVPAESHTRLLVKINKIRETKSKEVEMVYPVS